MNLLVTTQIVNKNDTNLGFFHEWLRRLAAQADKLYVICLYKGEFDLPDNVEVITLRKEQGVAAAWKYSLRFFAALWKLRGRYDGVFVHMNPEYIMLGGWLWRLTGKKVLLWYTHKAVNIRLRIAELFATKIFTASKESFRLPSKKIEVVGHGIPTENFSGISTDLGTQLRLMTDGRVTVRKHLEVLIQGVGQVVGSELNIFGEPVTEGDKMYYKTILELADRQTANKSIHFRGPIAYADLPGELSRHNIYVHASETGSIDKTVLQALAAGRIVVTSSEAYAALADGELKNIVFSFPPGDYRELAKTIENISRSGILKSLPNQKAMAYVRQNHNLDALIKRIAGYFLGSKV